MANHTGLHSLDKLAKDPRVVNIWGERDGCFDGHEFSIWLELVDGWNWEDCSCIHEATAKGVKEAFKSIQRSEV